MHCCSVHFISLELRVRLLVMFVQYEDDNYQDQNQEDEHQHHVQPNPDVVDHHHLGVSLLRVQQGLRLNDPGGHLVNTGGPPATTGERGTAMVTGSLTLGLGASQARLQSGLQPAVTPELRLYQLHSHSPAQHGQNITILC